MKHTVIIGGGLSGLCSARTIQRAGGSAVVLEAADAPGGRVRTDVTAGFVIDRGFQILLSAYPAVRQELDLHALGMRWFDSGALVRWQGKWRRIDDPFRAPHRALGTAASPLFPIADKLAVARLRARLAGMTVREIFSMPDGPADAFLVESGFSEGIVDRFLAPFYGGVFLEPDLRTSARMFAFLFKMFAEGPSGLPAEGMGAIAAQLAAGLAPSTLRLNARVESILREDGRAAGVRLCGGEELKAEFVVAAADFEDAGNLTGQTPGLQWNASVQACFDLPERLYREKLILLTADRDAPITSAALLTNIVPSYAPPGRHLLSVSLLPHGAGSDGELDEMVRTVMGRWFPRSRPQEWRLLCVNRVERALYSQPPGVWSRLLPLRSPTPGLFIAGEAAVSSSIQGALEAGQRAAGAVLSASR